MMYTIFLQIKAPSLINVAHAFMKGAILYNMSLNKKFDIGHCYLSEGNRRPRANTTVTRTNNSANIKSLI